MALPRILVLVLDDGVDGGRGASVGGDGDITLVGRAAPVGDRTAIEPGARFPG